MKLDVRKLVGVPAALAIACGGLSGIGAGGDAGDGGGGSAGRGGATAGRGGGTGSGGVGGTAGVGAGGAGSVGSGGSRGGAGGAGTKGTGGGGTKGGAGSGGSKGSGPFDASFLESALPDSSASPIETFELLYDSADQSPLSCPSEHWEFPVVSKSAKVYLRNTGSVPLAYIAENPWYGGAVYPPGVPTGTPGELVGVLAPGASVDLTSTVIKGSDGMLIALVGSPKPFSVYDGGYAASDEGTIPWPLGVADSTGATTMYVAEIQDRPHCEPVDPVW